MKSFAVIFTLVAVGCGVWFLAEKLSSDAVGMALGILFGVIAGLPAALLVMAVNRSQNDRYPERPQGGSRSMSPYGQIPQMPIILVTGQGPQQMGGNAYPQLPDFGELQAFPSGRKANGAREFRVFGEKDDMADEW